MNVLPAEVADAFRQAAITALQELAQLETVSDGSVLEPVTGAVVIATIHLLRERPGKLELVISENTAAALAVRYLPAGTELTTEMVNDVAGEFANVIAGQAKTMLKGTPYHFRQSTPAVSRAMLSGVGSTQPAPTVWLATELGTAQLLID
jgi:CheY-specific phosphatase CheX